MRQLIENFIETTNAGNIDATLSLFAPDAIIDDVSVGDAFVGRDGVRLYLERFFVGYHTVSKLLSIEPIDDFHADVRLDFTGDFGHETGILNIVLNANGLIAQIDADLD